MWLPHVKTLVCCIFCFRLVCFTLINLLSCHCDFCMVLEYIVYIVRTCSCQLCPRILAKYLLVCTSEEVGKGCEIFVTTQIENQITVDYKNT